MSNWLIEMMLIFMKNKKKKRHAPVGKDNTFSKPKKPVSQSIEQEKEINSSISDVSLNPLIINPEKSVSDIVDNLIVEIKKEKSSIAKSELKSTQTENSDLAETIIEKSFSNNYTSFQEKNNWLVVSASSIGKSHTKSSTPCQDNHYCESINQDWGIAICCDGAGSAINSQLGSKYVANEIAATYFKKAIEKNGWNKKNYFPTSEEWDIIAKEGFRKIYNSLEKLAEVNQIKINSLACTVIVIIYSPIGLLVTHIGDGRAGYCNEQGEWKSLITPHKGEEANQTIFITSEYWLAKPELEMSGVRVPESHVIQEKPIAFTLMSDGCESHSFKCSIMDKETNKWDDPNLPYPKFFNPLIENLKSMHQNNTSTEDANGKWRKFIESGTIGLEAELDDKTMILGVLV